jgi:hypothetical protein
MNHLESIHLGEGKTKEALKSNYRVALYQGLTLVGPKGVEKDGLQPLSTAGRAEALIMVGGMRHGWKPCPDTKPAKV